MTAGCALPNGTIGDDVKRDVVHPRRRHCPESWALLLPLLTGSSIRKLAQAISHRNAQHSNHPLGLIDFDDRFVHVALRAQPQHQPHCRAEAAP